MGLGQESGDRLPSVSKRLWDCRKLVLFFFPLCPSFFLSHTLPLLLVQAKSPWAERPFFTRCLHEPNTLGALSQLKSRWPIAKQIITRLQQTVMFLYLYDNITFEMGILICVCCKNTFSLVYLAVIGPLKYKHKILKVSPSKLMDSLTEIKFVFCEEINNLKAPELLPCLSYFCSAVPSLLTKHLFPYSMRETGLLINVVYHPQAWLKTHL